jgi:hypothetical protein
MNSWLVPALLLLSHPARAVLVNNENRAEDVPFAIEILILDRVVHNHLPLARKYLGLGLNLPSLVKERVGCLAFPGSDEWGHNFATKWHGKLPDNIGKSIRIPSHRFDEGGRFASVPETNFEPIDRLIKSAGPYPFHGQVRPKADFGGRSGEFELILRNFKGGPGILGPGYGLSGGAPVRPHGQEIAALSLRERALGLPKRKAQSGYSQPTKNSRDDRPSSAAPRLSHGFLGRDSSAPLSAQIGSVVGLSLIAGSLTPIGIWKVRGLSLRRWRKWRCACFIGGVCAFGMLGWMLSSA